MEVLRDQNSGSEFYLWKGRLHTILKKKQTKNTVYLRCRRFKGKGNHECSGTLILIKDGKFKKDKIRHAENCLPSKHEESIEKLRREARAKERRRAKEANHNGEYNTYNHVDLY